MLFIFRSPPTPFVDSAALLLPQRFHRFQSRSTPSGRGGEEEYVAYTQKCTHLSCAVYYSAKNDRLECPCHQGFFSVKNGSVLQGPPPRPLPQIILEREGTKLVAIAVKGT